MPSEMRRPGPIAIDSYVLALERQLSEEVGRVKRRSLPAAFHRLARSLRAVLQPILQSGAMALTSLAVIVAVGVAPATMSDPRPIDTPLAAPSTQLAVVTGEQLRDSLPPDEFLAASAFTSVRVADNRDTTQIERE